MEMAKTATAAATRPGAVTEADEEDEAVQRVPPMVEPHVPPERHCLVGDPV